MGDPLDDLPPIPMFIPKEHEAYATTVSGVGEGAWAARCPCGYAGPDRFGQSGEYSAVVDAQNHIALIEEDADESESKC